MSKRDEAERLIKELSEAAGPPGMEKEVRDIVIRELGNKFTCDRMGSVVHEHKGSSEGPRVMLTAHLDEVGFAVQSISRQGYLRLVPLGGWWTHTLLAQRVKILTGSGKSLYGVIGCIPVHHLSAAERKTVASLDQMVVDIGAKDCKDATERLGVSLGDPVVPESPFGYLNDPSMFMGKAFDDRAGVAAMIHVCKELGGKHPNTIFSVGTVQEEVGCRGATTVMGSVKPDVAILLEVSPADDLPGMREEMQGAVGKGVQIRAFDPTAIANRPLLDLAKATAEENNIPYQVAVRRSGGTDAREVHKYGSGVPSLVIGLPARYIHTHVSVCHVDDYLAYLELTMALCKKLDQKTVEALSDYS